MQYTIAYDKANYHLDGEFPKDLPSEQAFVHTGMFVGWVIDNDLYDKEFFKQLNMEKGVEAFKKRKITGVQIYQNSLDGALTNDDLSEEGNEFAKYYFDAKTWPYMNDYRETLCKGLPTEYHVRDTWENYDKLKVVMDKRYSEWKSRRSKKFWQFWK